MRDPPNDRRPGRARATEREVRSRDPVPCRRSGPPRSTALSIPFTAMPASVTITRTDRGGHASVRIAGTFSAKREDQNSAPPRPVITPARLDTTLPTRSSRPLSRPILRPLSWNSMCRPDNGPDVLSAPAHRVRPIAPRAVDFVPKGTTTPYSARSSRRMATVRKSVRTEFFASGFRCSGDRTAPCRTAFQRRTDGAGNVSDAITTLIRHALPAANRPQTRLRAAG